MKKTLLSCIGIILLSTQLNAQITFEHSYSSNGGDNDDFWYVFFTDQGINYYTIDSDISQIKFYNSTHINYKTIDLNLGSDYYINDVQYVTDKLFYSDDTIEFLVSSRSNSGQPSKYTLFNENGENLYEFGEKRSAKVIKNSDVDYKILVMNTGYSRDYDVYSLSGTLSVEQEDLFAKDEAKLFPNPTSDKIIISTNSENGKKKEINIYNVNGKKMITQNIEVIDNKIEVNVYNLDQGVYICHFDNQSLKFIKE